MNLEDVKKIYKPLENAGKSIEIAKLHPKYNLWMNDTFKLYKNSFVFEKNDTEFDIDAVKDCKFELMPNQWS